MKIQTLFELLLSNALKIIEIIYDILYLANIFSRKYN